MNTSIFESIKEAREAKKTAEEAEEFLKSRSTTFSILSETGIRHDALFSFVKIKDVSKDNRMVSVKLNAQLVETRVKNNWKPILSLYDCVFKFAVYEVDYLEDVVCTLKEWQNFDKVVQLEAIYSDQVFVFSDESNSKKIVLGF